MLISVQTASILGIQGIDKGFRMIAEAGFDGVDFNLDHCLSGKAIHNNECSGFFDQTDEEMRAAIKPYKDAAQKYSVKFVQAHAPFPSWVNNETTNAYVLEAIKKTIMPQSGGSSVHNSGRSKA